MQEEHTEYEMQFQLPYTYYLDKIDFLDWYRYFFIIRAIIDKRPKRILEIGAGNEVIKNSVKKIVQEYKVMDVNQKLHPDIVGDVRELKKELFGEFDCIIGAEILEHIPFDDVKKSLKHIYQYLQKGGTALITVPHQRLYLLFLWWKDNIPHVLTLPPGFTSPRAFYERFIKKSVWHDPHHCWEVGDGMISLKDIESRFEEVGFVIEKCMKLLYADFWVLRKLRN